MLKRNVSAGTNVSPRQTGKKSEKERVRLCVLAVEGVTEREIEKQLRDLF